MVVVPVFNTVNVVVTAVDITGEWATERVGILTGATHDITKAMRPVVRILKRSGADFEVGRTDTEYRITINTPVQARANAKRIEGMREIVRDAIK